MSDLVLTYARLIAPGESGQSGPGSRSRSAFWNFRPIGLEGNSNLDCTLNLHQHIHFRFHVSLLTNFLALPIFIRLHWQGISENATLRCDECEYDNDNDSIMIMGCLT